MSLSSLDRPSPQIDPRHEPVRAPTADPRPRRRLWDGPRPRVGSLLLGLAGTALVVVGLFFLLLRREYLLDGIVYILGGGACLWLARRNRTPAEPQPLHWATGPAPTARPAATSLPAVPSPLEAAPATEQRAEPPTTPAWRRWRSFELLLVPLLLAQILADLAATPPLHAYWRPTGFWALAILLVLLSTRRGPWQRPDLRAWWLAHRRVAIAVGAITLTALTLRVASLGGIPPTLGGDEGSQGLEAIRVLRGQIRNPFTTGWLGVPTMSFYFNAPSIALLGNTIVALRLPWALVGTATVPIVYWLVARLHGPRLGLMTAALLAAYHFHIHFSRLGSNQVADTFFVALALLFLYRGWQRRSRLDWALAGVVVGLGQYFYAGARFTAVIVAALLVSLVLRDPRAFWRERRLKALALVGAALVTAAPMIQYALRFPDEYNARVNQIGIIQSGWLEKEVQVRGTGPLPILLDQFQRAALAFNVYPDRTFWYGSPQPLLDFAAGAFFLLGLGYATLRLWNPTLLPFVAWFWGAVILGGALTESPPSSMRLITLAAPAMFFLALAADRLVTILLAAGGRQRRALARPILAAMVLAWSLWSVKYYFVAFTPLRVYGNFNAVVATALGEYARDHLGPQSRIYFFGVPRMYVDFGSIPYLAPEVEGVEIRDKLTAPISRTVVKPDKDAAFVFLPERRDELALVRQVYPRGELLQMSNPIGREPLFTLYRVPRAELAR